jgi:hypothetical protein
MPHADLSLGQPAGQNGGAPANRTFFGERCRSRASRFAYKSKEEVIMQYLLLIYDNEKRWSQGYDPRELQEYGAFGKEFATAVQGGNALQPTSAATTVRVRDGKRLTTDGPFAETKEQLGGYYLVEARDLDEAIHIASKIPGARHGSIEVRPIMKFS